MVNLLCQLARHKGVRWIFLSWNAFIAENLILSHNKEWIVATFSDDTYHYGYTALSLVACASTIYGYMKYGRHSGPIIQNRLWKINSIPFKYTACFFQTLGLIGLSQEFKSPFQLKTATELSIEGNYHLLKENKNYYLDVVCPIEHEPIKDVDSIYGIKRVCRYPLFWSNAFLWFGCALKKVHYTSVIMFIFPGIFALIGSMHQDYRYRQSGKMTQEIEDNSCLFPFISLFNRQQSWYKLCVEMKYPHLVGGVAWSVYLNYL